MAKKKRPRYPLPTPEEIEERCKEVQETWDEDTRISRIAYPSDNPNLMYPWTPPVIIVKDLPFEVYEDMNELPINDDIFLLGDEDETEASD